MAKAVADLRSLARSHTRMCVNVLAGIARQKTAPAAARVGAATALLERGWGKPQADVMISGDIKLTIRKMLDDDNDAMLIDVTPVSAKALEPK